MNEFRALLLRNVKLFFKDKGLFFTSLITPLILLVLYATFLSNVYRDAFTASLPAGFTISEDILNGCVGGQLVSSLLSVSCVTVAFCSNMLMVQDKVNGSLRDLTMSPVRPSSLAFAYFGASLLSTLIITYTATAVCFLYLAVTGWFLTLADVLLLLLDVLLLTLFGTALSSLINFFLSTQGQISAVGSIVSSCYGFISGAYMPISQFSEGLQNAISFLPGTYGTALFRTHAMRSAFDEMAGEGVPAEVVNALRHSVDSEVIFFERTVPTWGTYAVLLGATALILLCYVLLHMRKNKKAV